MSEIPVTDTSRPFDPTTTPAIERANRLISLRSHPGFLEVLRISQEMYQEAADICADYPGWDAAQIVLLKTRMQCAKEYHQALLGRINDAIETGTAEMRAQIDSLPAKSATEAIDQGDFVRQRVLEKFEEFDSRPSGSF